MREKGKRRNKIIKKREKERDDAKIKEREKRRNKNKREAERERERIIIQKKGINKKIVKNGKI